MGNKTVQSVECSSEEILGLGSLLVLLSIVGLLLNLTLVITLLRNRFLRSPNNCLVANLALTDIVYLTTTCVTSIIAIPSVEFRFSYEACIFLGFICHVSYTASINICAFISFHRFVSIVYPQRPFVTSARESQHAVISIWCLSGLLCLPGVFKANAYIFNPVVRTCTILSVAGSNLFFAMYSMVINVLLPLTLMFTFYIRIYRAVQMPSVSADVVRKHTRDIKRKSKHLMVAVLFMFLLSWLPFYVAVLHSAFSSATLPSSVIITVWILKLLNTITNPILYGFCNRLYFRCMLRLLRCRGPLRSKMSAVVSRDQLAEVEYFTSYPTATVTDKGTSGQTEGYTCGECLVQARLRTNRRLHMSVPSLISNGTQTARLSTVEEQDGEDGVEHEISGLREEPKEFTCSTCSCRSSIPTVLRYPIRRTRRSLSTGSQISHFAYGPTPTPTDSGRSSFMSQYVNTPSFYSNRTSFSSQFMPTPAGSARTSVTSQCLHYYSTPQGSSCNTPAVPETPGPSQRGIRRLPSLNSRQSFYSSLSASRSARSSLSSRTSHYNPASTEYSARSSVTSQLTSNQSTPYSTRPSTPGQDLLNIESELMRGFHGQLDSPKTGRSFSYTGRGGTGNRGQNLPVFQVLPEYGMFEELELARESANMSPRLMPSATPDPCSRLSVLMLGDLDPAEFAEGLEEPEEEGGSITKTVSANVKKAMQAWDGFHKFRRQSSSQKPRTEAEANTINISFSPRNSPRSSHSSPRASRSSPQVSRCRGSAAPDSSHRVDTIMEDIDSDYLADCDEAHRKDSIIDSIQKAVNLVLRAKRLRSRVRSIVVPIKPDTPVPQIPPSPSRCEGLLGNGACSLMNVREPIRFVYERPMPSNYYTFGQKPMSRLRVPGRPPPLNVPQTILEEDLAGELLPPETPTTRRRKNASTWIAPPVIDVDEGRDKESKGMRVECPGVLVEHHH